MKKKKFIAIGAVAAFVLGGPLTWLAGLGAMAYKFFFGEFIEYCLHSAGPVQVVHMGRACRRQMAQVRHFRAVFVECLKVEINSRFIGYGQKMKHTV